MEDAIEHNLIVDNENQQGVVAERQAITET